MANGSPTKTPDRRLTPEQMSSLQDFAERNGRRWKSRLCDLWQSGRDACEPEGPLLRQVRNAVGPYGLYRLKAPGVVRSP
jgi:hypothetical protein